MPVIGWFTRLVERLLPDRGSPLTRGLDPAALATPVVAIEAVRRTVANSIELACKSIGAALAPAIDGPVGPAKSAGSVTEIGDALRKAQDFISKVSGPPETEDEQRRRASTLHALDHAARLAEMAGEQPDIAPATKGGAEDARAAQLCAEAMRNAASVAGEVAEESALSDHAAPIRFEETPDALSALTKLEQCAKTLGELRSAHRSATLSAAATGALTADEAIVRVDTVRRLEALAHHAWRSAAHLVGRGE